MAILDQKTMAEYEKAMMAAISRQSGIQQAQYGVHGNTGGLLGGTLGNYTGLNTYSSSSVAGEPLTIWQNAQAQPTPAYRKCPEKKGITVEHYSEEEVQDLRTECDMLKQEVRQLKSKLRVLKI
jgi:hypothetical protein